MVRIAIVEDEDVFARQLEEYLQRYQQETKSRFSVRRFQDGDEIVEHYAGDFDIIFMDIQMRFLDGMTASEMIRRQDPEVTLILVSASPQYALRGYSVGALDYLLKPLNYYALAHQMDRAMKSVTQRMNKWLSLRFSGGIKKLRVSDLYYVESNGHKQIYHLNGEDFECFGSMRDTQDRLAEIGHFFLCSKGYLINLDYVDSVKENTVYVHGAALPVSRKRKTELLSALTAYMDGGLGR